MDEIETHDTVLENNLDGHSFAIAVVTATKPDIYKQAPLLPAADEHNVPSFVIHTGQHYDDVLTHGHDEYNLSDRIGANLNIRGGLSQKTSEMHLKTKKLTDQLNDRYGDTTILPIVHGDTLAAGIMPQAWMFATGNKVAHNEAGLRGKAPSYDNHADIEQFIEDQFTGSWEIDRAEPFPEQYDTFIGSAASMYHFAPTEHNKENLLREGYPHSDQQPRIPVVGNSIVDAIEMKKEDNLEESIFDIYPVLEERDDWIRIDIHRRANLKKRRFEAIIRATIELVEAGHNVCFIEMNATKEALEEHGYREKLEQLAERHENFLFTPLWKKHAHVYEFFESGQCLAAVTDSGSMQEELNHIEETICLTARFNTDRPETISEAGTNLLVPPISGEHMYGMIDQVASSEQLQKRLRNGPDLYGSDVGDEIIRFLEKHQTDAQYDWSDTKQGFKRHHSQSGFEYL